MKAKRQAEGAPDDSESRLKRAKSKDTNPEAPGLTSKDDSAKNASQTQAGKSQEAGTKEKSKDNTQPSKFVILHVVDRPEDEKKVGRTIFYAKKTKINLNLWGFKLHPKFRLLSHLRLFHIVNIWGPLSIKTESLWSHLCYNNSISELCSLFFNCL